MTLASLDFALVREEDGTPKFQTLPSDQGCAWLFQGIEISSSPGLGGKLGRGRVAAKIIRRIFARSSESEDLLVRNKGKVVADEGVTE